MGLRLGHSTSAGAKAFIIGVIVVLLLIPLTMLRGLISERSGLREQAYGKVAQGWGGDVTVGGPMLRIPTERLVTDGKETHIVRRDIYLLPSQLDVQSDIRMEPEPRYVGVYSVPVYMTAVHVTGQFDFASLQLLLNEPGVTYKWEEARLRLPLSDVRSLRKVERARLGQTDLKLGPAARGLYVGIEAPVMGDVFNQRSTVAFDLKLVLAGTRTFSVLPLGSTTSVSVRSDWPHPEFQGAFLPASRKISAEGFDAQWQVLELNRSYRQAWTEGEVDEAALLSSSFGVGLYQPVDTYQRAERAVKYAVLFIALTFLTFFTWEKVSRNRIHPLQYLLVGVALSVFYLLLIALSEHIDFMIAYVVAALALVALVGTYLAGALRSRMRGAIAASAMSLVYGLLYALILSEDYALLLGAIILFVAVAAVMLVTRRVDWYSSAEVEEM
jgi:inner membrane protein